MCIIYVGKSIFMSRIYKLFILIKQNIQTNVKTSYFLPDSYTSKNDKQYLCIKVFIVY